VTSYSRYRVPFLVLAGLCTLSQSSDAHITPNDVALQAYVHPEGQRLFLLVRAPLAAMQDIVFP
jgi:hypothetical protein